MWKWNPHWSFNQTCSTVSGFVLSWLLLPGLDKRNQAAARVQQSGVSDLECSSWATVECMTLSPVFAISFSPVWEVAETKTLKLILSILLSRSYKIPGHVSSRLTRVSQVFFSLAPLSRSTCLIPRFFSYQLRYVIPPVNCGSTLAPYSLVGKPQRTSPPS